MSHIQYDKNIFARNLKLLMDKNHSTQADIARLLAVSRSTVSAYCKGMQIPRMDKIEELAVHFGVKSSDLLEEKKAVIKEFPAAETAPVVALYNNLNEAGQEKLMDYGEKLLEDPQYQAKKVRTVKYIKHYLVPAAAGYAAPIQGEDYELIERNASTPAGADFCISISGDSMEPYIHDGDLVYVRRDSPLSEFDVGVFFVDGDVFCKQWCVDYAGTLHLLSANERRQDANIVIPRDSSRSCICFGKVILNTRLPRPIYY